jgi:hypothetical protein
MWSAPEEFVAKQKVSAQANLETVDPISTTPGVDTTDLNSGADGEGVVRPRIS